MNGVSGGAVLRAAAWAAVPILAIAGTSLLPGQHRVVGLLLAVGAVALQAVLAAWRRDGEGSAGDLPPRAAAWCLAAAVVAALALRLVRLGALPEGLWYDEAEAGLEAQRVLAEGPAIFARYTDNTALMYWAVAGLFALAGPSAFAVRLVSALAGVGVVLCCYLAGREAGGRGAGVAAAWCGAVAAWGITFSRLGMPYMTGALFVAASAWLLLAALRTGARRNFAAAGIVAGVGQYSYTTFRTFLPAAAAVTALALLRGGDRRRLAKGLGLFWLAAALVAAPLAVAAARQPQKYVGRIAQASVLTDRGDLTVPQALAANLVAHLRMFHVAGDPNGRHNFPGRPMLEPVAGAGLLLGVVALAGLPRLAAPLLALLFAGGLASGVLSLVFEAPQAARTSQLIPVVAILAGLGWWGWHRRRPPGRVAAVAGVVVLVGLAAWSAGVNARWYFVDQAGNYSCWSAHSPGPTWVARRWNSVEGERDVLIDPIYKGQRTIEFLAPSMATDRMFDPMLALPLDPGKGSAFLALSDFNVPYLDILDRLYPCVRRTAALGGAVDAPPRDRGALEILVWRGVPQPQAVSAVIPGEVLRGRAGWLTRGETATTIVSLPEPGLVEAADGRGVSVDGAAIGEPSGAGVHLVSSRVVPGSAAPALRLRREGKEAAPLPALYAADRLPPGWRARYRPLAEGKGFARFEWRPDRYVHIVPMPRPYEITWDGVLNVPRAGEYAFFVRIIGQAELAIDGAPVVTAGPEGEGSGTAQLAAGRHPIRLTFTDDRPYSQVFLDWTAPGGAREPLPYGLVTVE